MRAKIILAAFSFSFLISAAFANTYPPKPNAHFLGDANGDTGITGADIVQHYNYILSKDYTYDTLQPNNSVQAWNTCDMDSNRGCTGSDTVILNSYLLSKAVSVPDDPWSVNNINLPLTGNATATWIQFNIDLHSVHATLGVSGRPGVSVVVEIDPILSAGTGQLAGRECNPVAGSRDQATVALAQCALAVSQTNWPVSAGTGPTESGTYGLQVMGDGNGDLNLKVYTIAIPGLDIPATSTRLVVSFVAADTVALTCPSSVGEDATSSCTITASGGSSCVIGAGTTCTGATITDCTQIDIAAQGEAAGPGSCVVEVTKGTANDSKSITINEVNQAPTIGVACGSAAEDAAGSCAITVADADSPANTLTCSVDPSTTCSGVTLTGCTTANVPAQGEGGARSCLVAVTVDDNTGLLNATNMGSSSFTITDVNLQPTIALTCPGSVVEPAPIACTMVVGDSDVPADSLTCSIGAGDTCGGTLTGCTNYDLASSAGKSPSCNVQVVVNDNAGQANSTATDTYTPIIEPQSVSLTCPGNANETASFSCTITSVGGSPCTIGGATTCTGAAITDCTQIDIAAQGEAAGPGSCSIEVTKGAASDSKTITINEVNQNPVITSTCSASAIEGVAYSCALTATDADLPPQTLTWTATAANTCGGTITGSTYNWTPTEAQGGAGTCVVGVQVADNFAPSGTATQNTTVTPAEVNVAPTVGGATTSTSTGGAVTPSITATGADSDRPTSLAGAQVRVERNGGTCGGTVTGLPTTYGGGTISSSFTYLPVIGDGAGCTVITRACDQAATPLCSGNNTVTITITNTTPSLSVTNITVAEGATSANITATATDPDNCANNYGTVTTSRNGGTCAGTVTGLGASGCGNGGFADTFTYTAQAEEPAGTCTIIVHVVDGRGAAPANQTSTITITEVNQNPVITSTCSASASEGVAYSCALTATDADLPAQTLTWSKLGTDTCGGTVTGSTYNWTPSETQGGGTCVLAVRVADNFSTPGTADYSRSVTVNETNTRPTIVVSCGSAAENTSGTCSILVGDADEPVNTLTCSVAAATTCTGVTLTGCTTANVPAQGEGGARSCLVQVTVNDNTGAGNATASNSSGFSITDVNLPPSITNLPATKAGTITKYNSRDVNATDPDVPADSLTYVLGSTTCSFTPVVNGSSGLVSWTCGDVPESCVVDVTVRDNSASAPPNLTDTETLTIQCNATPLLLGSYDTSGHAYDVYVSGQYAYVAANTSGLQIIDISDPAAPILTGAYNTSGYAWDVYVSGQYAFVADDTAGLQIIDISDPAAPILTGTYDTPQIAYGVFVSGQYAFVVDAAYGLQIIDISDPAAPILTGAYNTSGYAEDVYVSGQYAYVADNTSGLQIIDISDPAAPTLTGAYNTPGFAYDIHVSGQYAYVADSGYGLQIIDISNPAAPSLTSTYITSYDVFGVYVSGLYAYVADYGFGVRLIDVSDPSAPTQIATYSPSDYAYGVFVSGQYVYVAAQTYGLQIMQFQFPVQPALEGAYDTPNVAYGVDVSGQYAYVADSSSGLQIVDISDPGTPTWTGTYNTPGSAHAVDISGLYAYVADMNAGLVIVDIADPAAPTMTGIYNTPGSSFGVYVSGQYAYVADEASGLQIIDISDPFAPTLTGTYNTPGNAYGVYLSGLYAFVADYDSGLQIIDVSNPASPTLAGAYVTLGYARGVYVSGHYAYVVEGSYGLQIINITDPAAPTLMGACDTPGNAESVYVSGQYAYVADYGPGLQVIDISDPAAPTIVGTYNTSGYSLSVNVSGSHAFIADEGAGLQVIRIAYP